MKTELIIFISLLVAVFFGTIVVNVLLIIARERASKEYFSKEHLEEYETKIKSFLEKFDIAEGADIVEIVSKIGFELKEKDKLDNHHEAEKDGNTILVDKTLSIRAKKFGIAHEIAHVIKGDEEPAARTPHSFKPRNKDEQICDYIAAALLLPLSDMNERLRKVDYESRSKKERLRFIVDLADEKNVSKEVVIRRINELRILNIQ